MMKWFITLLFACFSMVSQADFLKEIEALEASRTHLNVEHKTTPNNAPKPRRYITLSNGKKMDITDWQIVHFMASNCTYCHQFNPILKGISESTQIPVFTYSFDGKGDENFPDVFPTNREVINAFFAELPQATPTDFLVNVNTMVTLPLTQGVSSYERFLQRLDEVLIYVDQHLKGVN